MQINLINKKALVGGSTQGIGKAIAHRLAACGAEVTLLSRNEEKLKSIIKELPSGFSQKHKYIAADYYQFASFKAAIDKYFNEHNVDILVNNTCGPEAGNVFEKNTEDYSEAFSMLFQTVTHTTIKALQGMQKANFGRIINVSSVSVKEPIQTLALSNSIRSALISWMKTLSNEVAANNITVNNILTGYFATERLTDLIKLQAEKSGISQAEMEKIKASEIPAKRFGKPEEYGFLAAFLASEYSSYITGTNIPIDGGRLRST